jgi:hypothetical protein
MGHNNNSMERIEKTTLDFVDSVLDNAMDGPSPLTIV